MKSDKATLLIPILLITVGTGWLLGTLGVVPGVDWVWILGLAVVGLLTFILGGFDKATIVVGPVFLTASLLSVFRQTGKLSLDVEIPVLVIVTGVLMLIARLPVIPLPKWFIPDPKWDPQ